MQTPAWKDCQDDLVKYAGEAGIPRDTAWSQLTQAQRDWQAGSARFGEVKGFDGPRLDAPPVPWAT